MPVDPTTRPVDFSDWLLWRVQQPHPPPTVQAALDELHKLGGGKIVTVTIIPAVLGLINAPEPQVLLPDDVARGRLNLVKTSETFGGGSVEIFGGSSTLDLSGWAGRRTVWMGRPIQLSGWGVIFTMRASERAYKASFQLTDEASFRRYLDGELAPLGLSPPPDDEPPSLPEFGLWPPGASPPSPEHVGVEKLIDLLIKNYSENPGRDNFWEWCKKQFKQPRYHPVRRWEAEEAVHHQRAKDALGPVREAKAGRPRRNKKVNPRQN